MSYVCFSRHNFFLFFVFPTFLFFFSFGHQRVAKVPSDRLAPVCLPFELGRLFFSTARVSNFFFFFPRHSAAPMSQRAHTKRLSIQSNS